MSPRRVTLRKHAPSSSCGLITAAHACPRLMGAPSPAARTALYSRSASEQVQASSPHDGLSKDNPTQMRIERRIVVYYMNKDDLVLKEFFQGFDEAAVLFHGADGYPDVIGQFVGCHEAYKDLFVEKLLCYGLCGGA
jgi:hypothetical protein